MSRRLEILSEIQELETYRNEQYEGQLKREERSQLIEKNIIQIGHHITMLLNELEIILETGDDSKVLKTEKQYQKRIDLLKKRTPKTETEKVQIDYEIEILEEDIDYL